MKKIFTLCALFLSLLTHAQVTVSTLTDQFPGSGGVKLGPDGQLYIGNFGDALPNSNGTQAWRLDLQDLSLTLFASGFQGASGNAFDSQGNFYQANISGGYISKVTPAGVVSTYATQGISCPVGLVFDDEDNLYVCNCCGAFQNTIRKISSDGTSSVFSSGSLFQCPNGITIDFQQNLYVSNFNNGSVIKITPDGLLSLFASIPSGNNGHIAFSPVDTTLFVNSHGASRVYQLDMNGVQKVIAGSGARGNVDGPAFNATFSRPNGIAVSVTGDSLFLNSSIPTSNAGFPLNPSLVRMISGLRTPDTTINKIIDPIYPSIAIKLSPNPVKGQLLLEFVLEKTEDLEIQLNSTDGRLLRTLKTGNFSRGQHQLSTNIEEFPPGVYLISIGHQRGWNSRRFLIE